MCQVTRVRIFIIFFNGQFLIFELNLFKKNLIYSKKLILLLIYGWTDLFYNKYTRVWLLLVFIYSKNKVIIYESIFCCKILLYPQMTSHRISLTYSKQLFYCTGKCVFGIIRSANHIYDFAHIHFLCFAAFENKKKIQTKLLYSIKCLKLLIVDQTLTILLYV